MEKKLGIGKQIDRVVSSDSFNKVSELLDNIPNVESVSLESIEKLKNLFSSYYINLFKNNGYILYNFVSIISKTDKSVYFVGSPSNTLKGYIKGEERINNKGFVISQPCIRMHNLKKLFTTEDINWGSTFVELTTLGKITYGKEILELAIKYFYGLGFRKEDIRIQVSSSDLEFGQYLKDIDSKIEYDKFNLDYYRHKYGENNIFGKNFNFQLKKAGTEDFYDVGNFIIIYKDNKEFLIELALGLNIIIQLKYGLNSVIDTFPISYLLDLNISVTDKKKLYDSITSAVILYNEGVKINASDTRGRILRSYFNGIYFYAVKNNINFDKMYFAISELYKIYGFKDNGFILYMKNYFSKLEKKIGSGKGLNKEEKVIFVYVESTY